MIINNIRTNYVEDFVAFEPFRRKTKETCPCYTINRAVAKEITRTDFFGLCAVIYQCRETKGGDSEVGVKSDEGVGLRFAYAVERGVKYGIVGCSVQTNSQL